MTLRLSSACSNQLSYAPTRRVAPETGGADEDRTRDLLLAKQALSQLSYGPAGLVLGGCSAPEGLLSSTHVGKEHYVPQKLNCAIRSSFPDFSRIRPRIRFGTEVSNQGLLRKEVIQPQVPLRLPCYDFIPVTIHTFGACLLAVNTATSGADSFHDVTGGVYKARERIHGAVADAPLLAIPAS